MTATLESALLLADLEESGLTVRADAAGRLLVTPTAKLTQGQREDIKRWRDSLLALVAERQDPEAVARPPPVALMEVLTATPQEVRVRVWGTPYQWQPLSRDRLERFWAETGWTPTGGWKPGDRVPPATPSPAGSARPAGGGG